MALTWREEEEEEMKSKEMCVFVCVFSAYCSGISDQEEEGLIERLDIDGINENAASLHLFSIFKVPNCSQSKHKWR